MRSMPASWNGPPTSWYSVSTRKPRSRSERGRLAAPHNSTRGPAIPRCGFVHFDCARRVRGEQALHDARHGFLQLADWMLEQHPLGERDAIDRGVPADDEFMLSAPVLIVHLRIGELPAQVLEDQPRLEIRVYAHAVVSA